MKRPLAFVASLLFATSLLAARPIARWDVIPYQLADGVFKAGVVAFHDTPVKVVFSVNGKKAYIARKPIRNERTGVVEYVFPFDPSAYADGPVTLEAEVVPEEGETYKLPELPLYANAKKTLGSTKSAYVDPVNGNEFAAGTAAAPFKSINRAIREVGDGGTIYLLPGAHQMKMIGGGRSRKYWTTITPAPGVKRSDVVMAGGKSGTDKLLFRGLDLVSTVKEGEVSGLAIGEAGQTMAWFDDCDFTNKGGRNSGISKPFTNRLRAFVTGGATHDMAFGPAAEIVRKHEVSKIVTEAFGGNDCLVVNSKVTDMDAYGSTVINSEFFLASVSAPLWTGDVIYYNVAALDCCSRAFTARQLRNSAFVNLAFKGTGGDLMVSRFSEKIENVLFSRVRLVGQNWWWVTTDSGREDLVPKAIRLYDVKGPTFTGKVDDPEIKTFAEPLKM